MKFKGLVHKCRICGHPRQFLPTEQALRGAWVDEGTEVHHKCSNHRPRTERLRTASSFVLDADDDPRWTPWVQYDTHLGGIGCSRTKIAGRLTG